MKIEVLATFPENPTNPARTDLSTGVIEVNLEAWNLLPEYCQRFVIYHEIGHYLLQTTSEVKADDYALQKMALKEPYSLRNHIDSVYLLSRDDVHRKRHALQSVLKVAAENGNDEAINLLKTQENG